MADITIPDDTRLIAMEMNMDRSDHPLLVPFQCPAVVLMPVEQNEQAADKIRQLSTPETDFSTDILSLMQEEAVLPPSNSLVIHAADSRVISSMSRSLPDFTLIENAPAAGQSLTGQYINRYGSKLDAVSMGQLFSVSRTLSQTPDSPHTFRIPATIHFQKGALEKLKFADHQTRITFLYSDEDTLPSHTSSIIRQICQRYPSLKYQHVPLPRDAASGRSSEYFLTQLARTAPDCLIAMGGSQMMTAAKRLFNDYRQMLHGENSAFSGVPPQMEGEQPIQPEPGLILIPSLDGCHTALLPFCGYYDSQTNTLEDRAVHIEDLTIIADTHMASPGSDIASPGGDMADDGSVYPACMAAMADAFDAYLSNQGDDLTDAMALQAIALFLAWLPKLPDNMSSDAPDIRSQSSAMEHLQNACLLSGMAAAHTGIGLSRTMAGRLYCDFRLPTQTTQALLLPHILQYNGDIRPSKNAWILPACGYSMSDKILRLYQTAQMAASISPLAEPLTPPDMTRQLANIIQRILKQADIPRTIKACGIREKDYMLRIDIMAQKTFDQLSTTCADTNPRYPLIKEIVQLYRQIYE